MSARTPVFAANWKMNTNAAEGAALCQGVRDQLNGERRAYVVLCPPFTHLAMVRDLLAGSSISVGAQNMFWEPKGAFTGEISAAMLRDYASHVILGHSERRTYFGETDEDVGRKVLTAFAADFIPIVCVGETGEQRAAGETEAVLHRQLSGAFRDASLRADLIVAYEPVWAIGTGVSADSAEAQVAIAFIRAQFRALAGDLADEIRVLYGGSVTPANIGELMREADVDGGLIGGASLVADSFAELVRAGIAAALAR